MCIIFARQGWLSMVSGSSSLASRDECIYVHVSCNITMCNSIKHLLWIFSVIFKKIVTDHRILCGMVQGVVLRLKWEKLIESGRQKDRSVHRQCA